MLLAADWTNTLNTLDFTGDKLVSPFDAFVCINQLNARSIIKADGRLPDRAGHPDAPLWDANCDGSLTPNDVLRVINADQSPPSLLAALSNDTAPGGTKNDDRITSDARVSGSVSDDLTGISSLVASVDGSNAVTLNVDGNFSFDPGFVVGGSDDGEHTVRLTAMDGRAQSTSVDVLLSLDTDAPQPPSTPDLVASADGGASDTDDLTNDSTPTFIVNGVSDGVVRLLVGQRHFAA